MPLSSGSSSISNRLRGRGSWSLLQKLYRQTLEPAKSLLGPHLGMRLDPPDYKGGRRFPGLVLTSGRRLRLRCATPYPHASQGQDKGCEESADRDEDEQALQVSGREIRMTATAIIRATPATMMSGRQPSLSQSSPACSVSHTSADVWGGAVPFSYVDWFVYRIRGRTDKRARGGSRTLSRTVAEGTTPPWEAQPMVELSASA